MSEWRKRMLVRSRPKLCIKESEKLELKDKYKQHFIFHDYQMTLTEASELVERLEREPVNLENEEMMWKLRGFISRQTYQNEEKEQQQNTLKQASKDCDYYHEELKKLGVKVIQPGEENNGKIDCLYVTYHLNDEVIYKWYGSSGIPVIKLAADVKALYEELNK